jgi:hypothetical protein
MFHKRRMAMKIYIRWVQCMAMVCGISAVSLCGSYKETRSQETFDAMVKEKKYALVLFYQQGEAEEQAGWFGGKSKHKGKLPELDAQALKTFKSLSKSKKFKHHDEVNFFAVNVEKEKFGAVLFSRYSPERLPSYVLLKNGSEAMDWLQTYKLTGDMTEEQLTQFLDHVLQ